MLQFRRKRAVLTATLLVCAALSLRAACALDPRGESLLRNTLLLSAGVSAIALPVGVFSAWLLARTNAPGSGLGWPVAIAMLFMPLYLQAAGWDAAVGRQGWLASWNSLAFGNFNASQLALTGWPAAIWVHAMAAVPWVIVIAGRGLQLVEAELEETALLDGRLIRVALHVTCVRAMPSFVIAGLAIFVFTSSEIAVTDVYQIRTYAEEIYTFGPAAADTSTGYAQLASVFSGGSAVWFAMILGAIAMSVHLGTPARESSWTNSPRYDLGAWRWPAAVWLALLCVTMAGAPLASLLVQLGLTVERSGDGWIRFWSEAKGLRLLLGSMVEFRHEYFWSLIIGLLAATAASAVGLTLGRLARQFRAGRLAASAIIAAGFAIPGPAVGLAVLSLFNRWNNDTLVWLYEDTILAPVLAQTLRALPVTIWMSWYVLRTIPVQILEAARLDGASSWQSLWRVELPMRWPGLAATWLAAFTLCVGDLAATNLTAPPGLWTIPMRVFGLMHAGVDDVAAAICLIVVAVTSLASMSILRLWSTDRCESGATGTSTGEETV
jgi:iron(III) transport system permease protein